MKQILTILTAYPLLGCTSGGDGRRFFLQGAWTLEAAVMRPPNFVCPVASPYLYIHDMLLLAKQLYASTSNYSAPLFETAPFGSLRSKSFKISYKIFHLSAF